jgi:DNA-binding Lrp family transcriptional regulator
MGIRGNGLPGVVKVFGALDQEFGELVVDRSISPILQMSHFVPWLAHGGSGKRRSWKYHVCDALSGLDEVDEKILKLLQRTPLATTRDISQHCGIPASTVGYRLERMTTNGVIIGFGFGYEDRLLGNESVILSISTHGFAGRPFEAFFEYAQQHPRVSWIAQTVGTSDVELGVILEDAHELHEIIREVSTFGKGAIKNVHCHALVKTLKS